MFSDTVVLTDIHGTEDLTLNRVRQDNYSSEYLLITDLKEVRFAIRNTDRFDKAKGLKVGRHNVELIETVYPVGAVPAITRKAYFTFEVQQGDVIASATDVARELLEWLSASTFAALPKLANYES